MAQLNIKNPFLMTTSESDKELHGTFRDFTKEEKNKFDKKHAAINKAVKESQDLIKQINRVSKTASIKEKQGDYKAQEKALNELYALEDRLNEITDKFNADDEQIKLLKERFAMCLGGDDASEITELAETHGYDRVFRVIQESIQEYAAGKPAKSKNG